LNQDILNLAARWLKNPVMIEVEPEQVTLKTTDQRVYAVAARDKFALLFNLIQREAPTRMLVFRNRRDGVDRLARKLALAGVPCAALSGDVPQDKRIRILEDFRAGKTRVVVATDVAGRGIHVEGISHVVNYDIPEDAEDYVHRIGRTGRAGATGIAVTFACEEGAFNMPAIEKYIGRSLACIQPDEGWLKVPEAVAHKIAADAARPPFRRPAFRPHSRGRGRR
jgi:ATP-dependent RNA helicase RhlB